MTDALSPTSRRKFILLGRAEGISLLVLLFVAMPVKYILHEPLGVRIVGMLHGLLFMGYVAAAYLKSEEEKWTKMMLVICLILSCLPFGTFLFEKRYLRV